MRKHLLLIFLLSITITLFAVPTIASADPEYESTDYFVTTEGLGIKYHVTDDRDSLDCDVWSAFQYNEVDKPVSNLNFVCTLVKEGTPGGYFSNSSIGGNTHRWNEGREMTLLYCGFPVGN